MAKTILSLNLRWNLLAMIQEIEKSTSTESNDYWKTLFLKCFSDKEPMDEGPYKFSQGEIRDLSSIVDSIKETVYVMHSTNKLWLRIKAEMNKLKNYY